MVDNSSIPKLDLGESAIESGLHEKELQKGFDRSRREVTGNRRITPGRVE
jgi:hypothetical protein